MKIAKKLSAFILAGAIYTIFNNFSTCSDLKEKDYDVKLSDFYG